MSQVHEVMQREGDRLLGLPGVTGVAVGQKWVGGKATDEVAIHVYVERKVPEDKLRPGDRIPPTIGGHKTDVIEAGPFVQANGGTAPDDRRFRPLQPGAQITRGPAISPFMEETAGTISCLVQGTVLRYDGRQLYEEPNPLNSKPFLVTCAHVAYPTGHIITNVNVNQPSFGVGLNVVATVYTAVYKGTVDAALCQLSDGVSFRNDIPEIGPITGWLRERLRDIGQSYRVRKYGRSTRYTESAVLGVNGKIKIKDTDLQLHSQLVIKPTSTGGQFAAAGDSGAPVVNDSGELVGICSGVDPTNQTTIACQAADVFHQLAEAMRAHSGPDPSDPRYIGVGLQLAPFTGAVIEYPPVVFDDLVPIYRHQSREQPDRYFYDTEISSFDSDYMVGEEVFDAYTSPQFGTEPIYRHFAPDPNRYYYDTQTGNNYGWSPGKKAFHAFRFPRPGAKPIYKHRAIPPDPDRYVYDTQIQNDHGWSPGLVAFWAYPKGTSGTGGRSG